MTETTEKRSYGALETALRLLENVAALFGGVLMVISMFVTTLDAVLRYTIGSPLAFITYLNEHYLLVGMLSLPLAWGFRQGGYIRFVAILGVLPKQAGDVLVRVGLFASTIFVAMLAWFSWLRFYDAWVHWDIQMGVIDWPVAWSWAPVPLGLALLTLRLLFTALGDRDGLHAGEESFGDEL